MGKNKTKDKTPGHKNTRPSQNLKWEGVKSTTEPWCNTSTILMILGLLLIILMVDLYCFVDDPKTMKKAEEDMPEQPKKFQRPPKRPTFEVTQETDLDGLEVLIKEWENRVLVVAFEEANIDGNRRKLWKRWERIARAIPDKDVFKRLDDDEKPMVLRFDCSTPSTKAACEQLVGSSLPKAIFWKNTFPRFFPDDVRTDKQIFAYLGKQMEAAVTYFDNVDDAEFFITEPGINIVNFGADENRVFHEAADLLRDNARFGRTKDEDIIDTFEEASMDSIVMYRNFDKSPFVYDGDLSSETASAEIQAWVKENVVPLFGEWELKSQGVYRGRGVPVVFIGVDGTEDETEDLLDDARKLALEYRQSFSFTHLDSNFNADLAKRLGMKNLPEVYIMSGEQVRKTIDYDNVEKSIRDAIEEWIQLKNKAEMEDEDEYEDDYDVDYEDEDLDDEDMYDDDDEGEDDGDEGENDDEAAEDEETAEDEADEDNNKQDL